MLVQFGNNWIQIIPLTAKLDSACGLVQLWLSSEFFSSNYFQIGQHLVLLHIRIAAMLRDSVVVRTRPRAIPLAMITMRKSFMDFLFFPMMTMGLRLAPAGAPLNESCEKNVAHEPFVNNNKDNNSSNNKSSNISITRQPERTLRLRRRLLATRLSFLKWTKIAGSYNLTSLACGYTHKLRILNCNDLQRRQQQ